MWVWIILGIILFIALFNVAGSIYDEFKYRRMLRKNAEWQASESFKRMHAYLEEDMKLTNEIWNIKED